jgi:hypothetical protein
MRRVRVLIEDPSFFDEPFDPLHDHWCDVTICSGPMNPHDVCPLVANGHCPVDGVDVVVHALGGAWSESVRAAWRERGTIVVESSAVSPAAGERFTQHVGSAITALMTTADPDD